MPLRTGTKEDLETMLSLEREFFGVERAELREAYELILELGGKVLIEYKDGEPTGMLATVPVDELLQNRGRVLSLPQQSPFRERVKRSYWDGYSGYTLITTFVSRTASRNLLREFLGIGRSVGFVYDDEQTILNYERLGCRRNGTVPNIHSPEKMDCILVYEGRAKSRHLRTFS